MAIGAAVEVHRHLGPGFLEGVCEQAFALELQERRIPFERQRRVALVYKGQVIGEHRLDCVVAGELIVELKAVGEIAPIHHAQLLSYLKATGQPLGLLINFNVPILKRGIRRVVLTDRQEVRGVPT